MTKTQAIVKAPPNMCLHEVSATGTFEIHGVGAMLVRALRALRLVKVSEFVTMTWVELKSEIV